MTVMRPHLGLIVPPANGKVPVDGSCTTAGAALSGASYRYTAATGCDVKTPPQLLGSETVTAPRTVCCSIGF